MLKNSPARWNLATFFTPHKPTQTNPPPPTQKHPHNTPPPTQNHQPPPHSFSQNHSANVFLLNQPANSLPPMKPTPQLPPATFFPSLLVLLRFSESLVMPCRTAPPPAPPARLIVFFITSYQACPAQIVLFSPTCPSCQPLSQE